MSRGAMSKGLVCPGVRGVEVCPWGGGCLGGMGMSRDLGAGGGYIMGPRITAHQY